MIKEKGTLDFVLFSCEMRHERFLLCVASYIYGWSEFFFSIKAGTRRRRRAAGHMSSLFFLF